MARALTLASATVRHALVAKAAIAARFIAEQPLFTLVTLVPKAQPAKNLALAAQVDRLILIKSMRDVSLFLAR